jgi:uncharacterized phage protein (predicted DNA packaging)
MITLADAKLHCRIDHDDEDVALAAMIAAASDHLSSVGVDVSAEPPHPAVDHAMLMLVSHFYETRSAVSEVATVAVAIGVDRLIQPYREVHL